MSVKAAASEVGRSSSSTAFDWLVEIGLSKLLRKQASDRGSPRVQPMSVRGSFKTAIDNIPVGIMNDHSPKARFARRTL